jgi:hypothetical protein
MISALPTHPQLAYTDSEHLRLLGILGYVYAGLECFFGLFAALYMGIGLMFIMNHEAIGWMIVGFGALFALFTFGFAVLSYLSARWISQGKNWLFCIIVASLHCASFPLGTALGVFTIIVLSRPSIKEWFAAKRLP